MDLIPLLTHAFFLGDIVEAYELFGERRDGVMTVAIKPLGWHDLHAARLARSRW